MNDNNLLIMDNFLIVTITISTALPLLLLWNNKRNRKQKSITNSNFVNNKTLLDYAINRKLFLDDSRKSFLESQQTTIEELVDGKLIGRNRFRVLLLAVKSVGKTEICKLIQSYLKERHTNVVAVYIPYDSCSKLISDRICDQIYTQKGIRKSKLNTILSTEEISDRIDLLEDLLEQQNLRVVLIIDEFQFVYSKTVEIGVKIIREKSTISGSTRGNIHCIVTGSSSNLRSLAFAKLPREEENKYPSYVDRIDLNCTKLRPKCIFPIVKAEDFEQLLNLRDENIALRYFCSGGRPGLALEATVVNVHDIRYNLTAKHLLNDESPQGVVLKEIFDSIESMNPVTVDEAVTVDDIRMLESDLQPVQDSILWKSISGKDKNMDTAYEQMLYQLARR